MGFQLDVWISGVLGCDLLQLDIRAGNSAPPRHASCPPIIPGGSGNAGTEPGAEAWLGEVTVDNGSLANGAGIRGV